MTFVRVVMTHCIVLGVDDQRIWYLVGSQKSGKRAADTFTQGKSISFSRLIGNRTEPRNIFKLQKIDIVSENI